MVESKQHCFVELMTAIKRVSNLEDISLMVEIMLEARKDKQGILLLIRLWQILRASLSVP